MSLRSYIGGMPRISSRTNVSPRRVFRSADEVLFAGGRIISGACSRDPGNSDIALLRPGLLMGKIGTVVNSLGTVGHYAPSILGVTTSAEAAASTSIQASAAVVTELVRRCGASGTFQLVGPGVANGALTQETVTYSAASGTDITVTAILNHYVAGSFILPTDGSEEPLSVIPESWGIYVTDPLTDLSQDQPWPELPIGGLIDSSQLLPVWPSDASLQQWIVDRLSRASGGKFTFDHTY